MAELPHLTLYLRRMRLPERSRSLSDWITGPYSIYLIRLLTLPLIALIFRLLDLPLRSADLAYLEIYRWWLHDILSPLLGFIAWLWSGLLAANAIRLLSTSLNPERSGARNNEDLPDWYITPLRDSQALLSALFIGLIECLPPLLGGAAALALLNHGLVDSLMPQRYAAFQLMQFGMLDYARLPHLLLLLACAAVALRGMRYLSTIVAVLACMPAVHWLLGNALLLYEPMKSQVVHSHASLWRAVTALQFSPMADRYFANYWAVHLIPLLYLLVLYIVVHDNAERRRELLFPRALALTSFLLPHLLVATLALRAVISVTASFPYGDWKLSLFTCGALGAVQVTSQPGSWMYFDRTSGGIVWTAGRQPFLAVQEGLWLLFTLYILWKLAELALYKARHGRLGFEMPEPRKKVQPAQPSSRAK